MKPLGMGGGVCPEGTVWVCTLAFDSGRPVPYFSQCGCDPVADAEVAEQTGPKKVSRFGSAEYLESGVNAILLLSPVLSAVGCCFVILLLSPVLSAVGCCFVIF